MAHRVFWIPMLALCGVVGAQEPRFTADLSFQLSSQEGAGAEYGGVLVDASVSVALSRLLHAGVGVGLGKYWLSTRGIECPGGICRPGGFDMIRTAALRITVGPLTEAWQGPYVSAGAGVVGGSGGEYAPQGTYTAWIVAAGLSLGRSWSIGGELWSGPRARRDGVELLNLVVRRKWRL